MYRVEQRCWNYEGNHFQVLTLGIYETEEIATLEAEKSSKYVPMALRDNLEFRVIKVFKKFGRIKIRPTR